MSIGDRVRIGRDEVKYPSRGTWPRFRGRTGTVVELNRAGKFRRLEIGVQLGTGVVWFLPHEVQPR